MTAVAIVLVAAAWIAWLSYLIGERVGQRRGLAAGLRAARHHDADAWVRRFHRVDP